MAYRVTCKLCGRRIVIHDSYVVRIDVFADPTTAPIDTSDEQNDPDVVIPALLEQMEKMSAEELQDQVHRRIEFRICCRCQPHYLANPLGLPRARKLSHN